MKKKKILSLVALGALLILPLSVNAAAYPIRTVIYSSAELVRRDAQSSSTYSRKDGHLNIYSIIVVLLH